MFRLAFSCLILLSSCSTVKHVTRDKTTTETTTTTTIDTTVKVIVPPITVVANPDTLKTFNHLPAVGELISDTLTNNGDTLIINRNASKVAFIFKQKPKDVKVYAKKVEHKKEVFKSVKKDVKRTNYIPLLLIIAGVVVILLFWRKFVK